MFSKQSGFILILETVDCDSESLEQIAQDPVP